MANPIQQGLKLHAARGDVIGFIAAMANPIQQGLKQCRSTESAIQCPAAMANPIQQGLKHISLKAICECRSCRNG